MKIPDKITIVGTEWPVEMNNKKMNQDRNYGLCDYDEGKIYYCTQSNEKERSKAQIEEAFIHEWAHAMLWTNGLEELNNEKTVQILAANILQLINQVTE